MWLFTRYGFFSIAVTSNTCIGEVAIRSRSRAHLETLKKRFPKSSLGEIKDFSGSDYRFRCTTSKAEWALIIAELAKEQTWSNFKAEASKNLPGDITYKSTLHKVWGLMKHLEADSLPMDGLPVRQTPGVSVLDEKELPDVLWDGITKPDTLEVYEATLRNELAAAAKRYEWPKVLSILQKWPQWANATRLGGKSLYTPLHQAAHAGASVEVVTNLLQLGAWRTLRNAHGDRPIDIAIAHGRLHLKDILQPVYCQNVAPPVIAKLQDHFHLVIREVLQGLDREHSLRLPELEVMLEYRPRKFWFNVPGMFGGFSYWLSHEGVNATLQVNSWCRLEGGAGNRHSITTASINTEPILLW